MYRIEVNINELYLRLGELNKNDKKDEIYLQFEWKYKNKWTGLKERVGFEGHLQKVGIGHVVYVKEQDIVQNELKYRVLLVIQGVQQGEKLLKYGGECVIQLKDYYMQSRELPFAITKKFQLLKCPDNKAYLEFTIRFEQLMDFRLLVSHHNNPRPGQSLFGGKNQILQQQSQLSQRILKQAQKIQDRNKRLSNRTQQLKSENQQLLRQLKQKKHSIRIDQQLKQDKLDMLIERKLKAQQAYKRVKERVAYLYNVINQYGRPELIEEITNIILAKSQQSYT